MPTVLCFTIRKGRPLCQFCSAAIEKSKLNCNKIDWDQDKNHIIKIKNSFIYVTREDYVNKINIFDNFASVQDIHSENKDIKLLDEHINQSTFNKSESESNINEIKNIMPMTLVSKNKNYGNKSNLNYSINKTSDKLSFSKFFHKKKKFIKKYPFALKSNNVKNVNYEVGDLFWGLVTGHPWWPCIIVIDTISNEWKRHIRKQFEYRVFFLGMECEYGWISTNRLISFEGRLAFEAFRTQMISLQPRFKSIYEIKASRLTAWCIAVSEAEQIFSYSKIERIDWVKIKIQELIYQKNCKKSSKKKIKNEKIYSNSSEADSEEDKIIFKKSRRSLDNSSTNKIILDDKMNLTIPNENNIPKQKLTNQRLSLPSKFDNRTEILKLSSKNFANNNRCEDICRKCECVIEGDIMKCRGICASAVHPRCVDKDVNDNFMCDQCSNGVQLCFVCKKLDKECLKCSFRDCTLFYHKSCLLFFPTTSTIGKVNFVCPHHSCATCAADIDLLPEANKGRFVRCIRCPMAFHANELCLSAGSKLITNRHIVCADHHIADMKRKYQDRINVSWCFICAKGGTLLCCDYCPASYHRECLSKDLIDCERWICELCRDGKRPTYGEIVWVKVGHYRWWPGEICHPRNVPLKIINLPHSHGEFPVHFFGSHDYYWLHRGRVFNFQEGDEGSKSSKVTAANQYFKNGVKEASEALSIYLKTRDLLKEKKYNRKPPPYKFIKTNFPIGNVEILKLPPSQLPVCLCSSSASEPCGPESNCINRLMLYECESTSCPAGERCLNQRMLKRQDADTEPFKTDDRGWGLRAKSDIVKGQFIHEYVGDLIDEEECGKRLKFAHDHGITNFYMLILDKNRIIDAGPKGNHSRFMNHSCGPNCETQKWTVLGDIRVGIFAKISIKKGDELTFNYNLVALGDQKTQCQCGAKECSGFLGERPKNLDIEKPSRNKKKKIKPKLLIHDDECFKCGGFGELVMCDRPKCTKIYHLECLELSKLPRGKWICPWHICDDCTKWATKLCAFCPNSYCGQHYHSQIKQMNDGKFVCADHEEFELINEGNLDIKKNLMTNKVSENVEFSNNTGDFLISNKNKVEFNAIESNIIGNKVNTDDTNCEIISSNLINNSICNLSSDISANQSLYITNKIVDNILLSKENKYQFNNNEFASDNETLNVNGIKFDMSTHHNVCLTDASLLESTMNNCLKPESVELKKSINNLQSDIMPNVIIHDNYDAGVLNNYDDSNNMADVFELSNNNKDDVSFINSNNLNLNDNKVVTLDDKKLIHDVNFHYDLAPNNLVNNIITDGSKQVSQISSNGSICKDQTRLLNDGNNINILHNSVINDNANDNYMEYTAVKESSTFNFINEISKEDKLNKQCNIFELHNIDINGYSDESKKSVESIAGSSLKNLNEKTMEGLSSNLNLEINDNRSDIETNILNYNYASKRGRPRKNLEFENNKGKNCHVDSYLQNMKNIKSNDLIPKLKSHTSRILSPEPQRFSKRKISLDARILSSNSLFSRKLEVTKTAKKIRMDLNESIASDKTEMLNMDFNESITSNKNLKIVSNLKNDFNQLNRENKLTNKQDLNKLSNKLLSEYPKRHSRRLSLDIDVLDQDMEQYDKLNSKINCTKVIKNLNVNEHANVMNKRQSLRRK